ncbi:polysaccharide biosynthesis tyrosine autokinase [Mycolicibacterium sp. PDY-3]|uniref:polysaccharide biosynthesis tyrosine autokinase n=1 Tax=Mycolicibacterium sp. PDY-3 TaxID=3376069 RepID=UPI0037A253E7
MNARDYVKLLRARWLTMLLTFSICLAGAVAYTLLTTPMYEASTRLFVSTSAGASLAETYQGNRSSQERVFSYTELLTGETLAQRTVDKLGLDLSAKDLTERITASSKPDTVLIDVDVVDSSPVRARDIANVLSDEFVRFVSELENPEGAPAPDTRVIVEQRASIPEDPVVPNVPVAILVGALIGLLSGFGLAVARHIFDNTVKDRETVELVTGTGLVGTIPRDKDRRAKTPISFSDDNSAIAESFRKLRTNLHFLSVDNPPRVIVLTSSVPSEGKSTTAVNIALALAESGHTVALVDGDMRRPMLHNYLSLVGAVGFSTVLSGQVTVDEAIQETKYPGLSVLTAGTIPPNPSELLASQAARKVINDLRQRFEYVIIDTTPLLAVTDAAVLSAAADGVLIVVRFGHTKRDQVAHATASLSDVDAHVLGTVLTIVPIRGGSAYSYSYYGESKSTGSRSRSRYRSTKPPSDKSRSR